MKTIYNKIRMKGLLVAAFMFGGLTAMAQPANDLCSNAAPLSCGQTVAGTTSGATFDATSFCGTSNTAPGVWYVLTTPPGAASLNVSTCNQASYDTKLTVFSGSCGSLTCVGGQDDAAGCSGFTTNLTVSVSGSTTYYILVHGFSSATGNFNLTASCTIAAGNDVCSGATPIACNSTESGTTVGSTFDGVGFCGTSNTAPGVWYEATGTGGPMIASTCTGTFYDSKLSVFTGTCGSLSCVGGNDDACGLQSSVQWNSTSGTTYYILVHGFGSATGAFDLTLDCPLPPANDNACDAQTVTFGITPFDNRFATVEAGEPSPGAGTGTSSCNSTDGWCSFETDVDNSVWFEFTAPASGCVRIVADGPGFDSQLALWSGDCNNLAGLTEIAANDDSGDDLIPGAYIFAAGILEAACLTPGDTYLIQVDGFNGDETADGELHLIDCGGTLPVVSTGGCQSRFLGYAPAEAELNYLEATVTGGVPPYTFSWSPAPSFQVDAGNMSTAAVQPATTTTYTVTVTDGRGCTSSADITVNVIDVSCGNNGNKVLLCHYPNGNPNNPQNICISPNAVPAHLGNHGLDHLGPCSNPCLNTGTPVSPPPPCVDATVTILTDNFPTETSWTLTDLTSGMVIDGVTSGTYTSSGTTFVTTNCVDPTHCYEFRIADTFGDGICCSFGLGSYEVTFDGAVVASGGAFGSSESTQFGNCGGNMIINNTPTATNNPLERNAYIHDHGHEHDMDGLQIAAYPNPSEGLFTLKVITPETGQTSIELFDLEGRVVAPIYSGTLVGERIYTFQFDGSGLASGAYVYKIVSGNNTDAGRILIK